MKTTILLLLLLVSGNAMAEWKESFYKIDDWQLKEDICEKVVEENSTPFSFDVSYCEGAGDFIVKVQYFTLFEGKKYKTIKKVDAQIGSLACDVKLKKSLGGARVDRNGHIRRYEDRWDVYSVRNCQTTSNRQILSADIDDSNVKKLSKIEFSKLPQNVRDNLNSSNLPSELGDGYYDSVKVELYKILDLNNGNIVGFIMVEHMTCTESGYSEPDLYYVRSNANGERVSSVGDYE